jgi:hypothetical protein
MVLGYRHGSNSASALCHCEWVVCGVTTVSFRLNCYPVKNAATTLKTYRLGDSFSESVALVPEATVQKIRYSVSTHRPFMWSYSTVVCPISSTVISIQFYAMDRDKQDAESSLFLKIVRIYSLRRKDYLRTMTT